MKHRFEEVNNKKTIFWLVWTLSFFIAISTLVTALIYSCKETKYVKNCPDLYSKYYQKENFIKDRKIYIWNNIKKYNIFFDTLVYKQFQQESGIDFNSDLANKYNNISGMQIADVSRKSTIIGLHTSHKDYYSSDRKYLINLYGKYGGYGIYKDISSCILDYKYFQEYIISKYFKNYLDKYYSEKNDGSYIKNLNNIKFSLK